MRVFTYTFFLLVKLLDNVPSKERLGLNVVQFIFCADAKNSPALLSKTVKQLLLLLQVFKKKTSHLHALLTEPGYISLTLIFARKSVGVFLNWTQY